MAYIALVFVFLFMVIFQRFTIKFEIYYGFYKECSQNAYQYVLRLQY